MSTGEENLMKNSIIDCLTNQINEFELLKSMYPNTNDIVLGDKNILDKIEEFVNNKTEYTPSHLDFVVNIQFDSLKLEICINLPTFYPKDEPDIYVRCNGLTRKEETNLNTELTNYLKANYSGEVCLYTAISWIQENVYNHYNTTINKHCTNNKQIKEELEKPEAKFVRFWVYSHHIYNKKKRDEIVKKAKELNLTGFCLPGKPGIICIEGTDTDCKDWWRYIKSMTWKKIMIRKTETFEISEKNTERKFSKFEEIHFQNSTSSNNKHADMSGLSKFMEERGLSQTFHEFFGLCNNI